MATADQGDPGLVVSGSDSTALHAAGAKLILAAFRLARDSGREGWQRMTIAVLKNRIIKVTQGSFDQSQWGAEKFLEFVRQYPELVSVDRGTQPPTVELRDPTAAASVPDEPGTLVVVGPNKRIRHDLWEAVLDYSSGVVYLLDDQDRVVSIQSEELTAADDTRRLPTIQPEILDGWRGEFVAEQASAGWSPRVQERLQQWVGDRRPDVVLPRDLRHQWNAKLKQHVLAVLGAWYSDHGRSLPNDAVEVETEPVRRQEDTTDRLRDLVVRCVQAMTRDELEELRLPAAAFLRIEK